MASVGKEGTMKNATGGSSANPSKKKNKEKLEKEQDEQIPASCIRVLVVDDDRLGLVTMEKMLRKFLYKVTTCSKAADALAMVRKNQDEFDIVITDNEMPEMNGFTLLKHIKQEMNGLPVIMMSADGRRDTIKMAGEFGAEDYWLKPVSIEKLEAIPNYVVRKK